MSKLQKYPIYALSENEEICKYWGLLNLSLGHHFQQTKFIIIKLTEKKKKKKKKKKHPCQNAPLDLAYQHSFGFVFEMWVSHFTFYLKELGWEFKKTCGNLRSSLLVMRERES